MPPHGGHLDHHVPVLMSKISNDWHQRSPRCLLFLLPDHCRDSDTGSAEATQVEHRFHIPHSDIKPLLLSLVERYQESKTMIASVVGRTVPIVTAIRIPHNNLLHPRCTLSSLSGRLSLAPVNPKDHPVLYFISHKISGSKSPTVIVVECPYQWFT